MLAKYKEISPKQLSITPDKNKLMVANIAEPVKSNPNGFISTYRSMKTNSPSGIDTAMINMPT